MSTFEEKMHVDNDTSWNTSKPECEFTLFSVSKEALTNINYTGKTNVIVNYYKVTDGDTELLEFMDDGKGFPDEDTFMKALTLSSTTGEGNSNFGVGMKSQSGVAQKMFQTLANKNINILAISTSEIKISVLIDKKYTKEAVKSLHAAYNLN